MSALSPRIPQKLIAGERRWRATQRIPGAKTIAASIRHGVSDVQARRMGAAENLQRADLSPVEAISGIVEMVDAELITEKRYRRMGGKPLARVKFLLMKLDSDRRNGTDYFSSKFAAKIDQIFANLPKPQAWVSFCTHDLPLITSLDDEVLEVAIQEKLNKSQTEALAQLKKTAPRKFKEVQAQGGVKALQDLGDYSAPEAVVPLYETSAREIRHITTMARLDQATLRLAPVATPPLPSGKYRCLVIDPPWPMEKIEREVRPDQGDQLVYPVMSLDDIAALPEPSPHQRPAPRGSDT